MFGSVGLPHGFCFLWNPQLLWLHVLSDALIALAYFLIPVALLRIVRKRRDIPFNAIFFCFAAFIVACGVTHVMEVVTLWKPVYWISGSLKAMTAAISLATLVLLIRLTPTILSIPRREDLARANRELTAVLESTTMCVLAMDREWQIRYMNHNAKTVLRTKNNLVGLKLWDALPGMQTQTVESLRTAMHSRKPAEYESYYPPLDLSTSVQALPSENGGLTLFFSDISQQRRLQQQLEVERALREQRIESLAQMAGGLAHEISNPLGIIHARASDLAELAQDGAGIAAEVVTAACTSIVKTSDRAIRILRGLRMFAREGAHDPMERTALANLIEQAVDLVQTRFTSHGIKLDVVPVKTPDVSCREVQIGQIILNLLNNAFDAVDGAAQAERWVRVQASHANGFVHIDIVDSGPGVAPEYREHLMQPFYTTKPLGAGMGVGLSLSRTIAQDHNGTLVLTEVEGHTCFRLSLPIAPNQTHAHEDAADARVHGIGPLSSQGVV
jgi:two-component system NtrC family sensor kinase